MGADAELRAFEALSRHPRKADLTALARRWMSHAFDARRSEVDRERVTEWAAELNVPREEAATPFGNAVDVLERGAVDASEQALARALAAHVISSESPGREHDDRAAGELLWLATHTAFDATGLLDAALGEDAAPVWDTLASRIRRIDRGGAPDRGEVLVAATALAGSSSRSAVRLTSVLAAEVRDPKVVRVLTARTRETSDSLQGERVPAPRSAAATVVLACTGFLLVMAVCRLVARLALAYRQPAEVTLTDDGGVRVRWRVELLGRTIQNRDVVIPRGGLVRAFRELRYPRAGLYAGLVALALGSYVGVSCFVDGIRAASPSMLAVGWGIVSLGLAFDFVLSSIEPGARGRCRVSLRSAYRPGALRRQSRLERRRRGFGSGSRDTRAFLSGRNLQGAAARSPTTASTFLKLRPGLRRAGSWNPPRHRPGCQRLVMTPTDPTQSRRRCRWLEPRLPPLHPGFPRRPVGSGPTSDSPTRKLRASNRCSPPGLSRSPLPSRIESGSRGCVGEHARGCQRMRGEHWVFPAFGPQDDGEGARPALGLELQVGSPVRACEKHQRTCGFSGSEKRASVVPDARGNQAQGSSCDDVDTAASTAERLELQRDADPSSQGKGAGRGRERRRVSVLGQ